MRRSLSCLDRGVGRDSSHVLAVNCEAMELGRGEGSAGYDRQQLHTSWLGMEGGGGCGVDGGVGARECAVGVCGGGEW